MITYVIEGESFGLSYQKLKEDYRWFCNLTDKEFTERIAGALHLACVICFLKEIPAGYCLSDRGIIHELVHVLHIGDDNTTSIKEIRKLFEQTLKLD